MLCWRYHVNFSGVDPVLAGEDAFTLHNAALFIDDYLGAYPNGICLSSFVSCPTYYGFYRRGYW